MTLRIIHTSDWQIRKVFRFVDGDTMGLLQAARLDSITRLGELATAHGVQHILVAGDVYDAEALTDVALRQPVERMRAFGDITWHLLPGNHDPQRPFGLWDRLRAGELPANVIAHVEATPYVDEEARLALLPAPLNFRATLDDPTAYMDQAATPEGMFRIGLAHGSVATFGGEATAAANYINPTRAETAGLDYLALGDWHGLKRINARVWYSGTHETDAFDVDGGGQVLLVTIDAPGAVPQVTPLPVGRFHWHRETAHLGSREDIDRLDSRMRALGEPLSNHLLYLTAEGTLSLDDLDYFERTIQRGLAAALCCLRLRDDALLPRPTTDDLDSIEKGGFVRAAADRLAALAADESNADRGIAARALQRLYVEHRKLEDLAQ